MDQSKPEKTSEKSVIDYVLTTPQIAKNIQSIIVDEDGSLRVKGKKESDHNTIVMSIKINDSRQPTYKQTWKINNTEGWEKFNVEIENPVNKERIEGENYKEAEKTIKHILNSTIGTRKVRTDKTRGITNEHIKAAKKAKKEACHKFNQACKNGSRQNKENAKKEYLESRTKLRTEKEKAEAKLTEEKLGKIYENSKINPNTIWEAMKKARGCKSLDYNTVTEDGKQITDPIETKEHIANYFEELYQAREGTEEYKEWTEQIKKQ